jgi:hypothetical protein
MKKFKTNSIDLKKMETIRGGGTEITLDNLTINKTKLKPQVLTSEDTTIEVSGTVNVEM